MDNPITYAVSRIRREIPQHVLERAFFGAINYLQPGALSLDSMIRDKVINQKVMVDCNLTGGTELTISLRGLEIHRPPSIPYGMAYNTAIVRIPPDRTNNRDVVSALSLISSTAQGMGYGNGNQVYGGGSAMGSAYNQVLQGHNRIPNTENTRVSIVSPNVVLVEGQFNIGTDYSIVVLLENEANYNNLRRCDWPDFAELCTLAAKEYIHMTLSIAIGQGIIQAGSELNVFSQYVEEYRDATQMYKDFYNEKWQKIQVLTDPTRSTDYYKMITGGGY